MDAPLKTRDLVKTFGGIRALDGVSIDVYNEKITLIIGPNGSGKTTLINVITGFYHPERGEVKFNGSNITGLPPFKIFEKGIVRTFQIPHLFKSLTVLENMLVASRNNPGEKLRKALFKNSWRRAEEHLVEKALRILELLNLDHLWDKPACTLSGGQMKLLEIGRALMADPLMVLMDEPIAGVNPRLANEIFEHLLSLRKELNLTFLIVEHRLDIALPYADYVYAMDRGKIISKGSPSEVLEDKIVARAYLGG